MTSVQMVSSLFCIRTELGQILFITGGQILHKEAKYYNRASLCLTYFLLGLQQALQFILT